MFARFMKRTREAIPAGRVMPRLSASRSHRAAESSPSAQGGTPSPFPMRRRSSGVAFTADPLTGETSATLVSAIAGLGDALVSGRETPDEWRVVGDRVTCEQSYQGAVDEGEVRRVAELAGRVEERLGRPQDIEWALSRGRLYLLQARPITAL